MTLAAVVNKTVGTDGNPYNLYSYPQRAVVEGVLKLWAVEISAAGLCRSRCKDVTVNRCVYSRLINVVITDCRLITGHDFDFLHNVKECNAVYSGIGILVPTFR